MPMPVTPKMLQLYQAIQQYYLTHNVMPTIMEMATMTGAKSKSSIVRLLNSLEERGWIKRLHHRVRAIELLVAAPPITATRVEVQRAIDDIDGKFDPYDDFHPNSPSAKVGVMMDKRTLALVRRLLFRELRTTSGEQARG